MSRASETIDNQLEQALEQTRSRIREEVRAFIVRRISQAKMAEIVDDNVVRLFIDYDDIPSNIRVRGGTLWTIIPVIRQLSPNIMASMYATGNAIVVVYCPDKDKASAYHRKYYERPDSLGDR